MAVEFSAWHLLAAYGLDLIIGDPRWMPHPIRWIGALISGVEKRLYPQVDETPVKPRILIAKGGLLVISTLIVTLGSYFAIVLILPRPVLDIFYIWFASTLIATRSLHTETARVIKALEEGDLQKARRELSWLVSRDTENLDHDKVLKSTLETLSENISDGVIAPIFYLGIGGPILGLLYKTVNTLDSMVGYRNDRYLYFGKIAARFDDLLNFIPARLSGLLIVFSAWILHKWRYDFDWRRGLKIMHRDGRLLSSPNAGIPIAAMAGLLGVSLGGPTSYFGKVVNKPVIGDDINPLSENSYKLAVISLYVSSLEGLFLAMGLRFIVG
ncbi:MAG: adenosylcobinamide-phosphate synthase CbiB [Thermodesulforhabdaceae bacterium]